MKREAIKLYKIGRELGLAKKDIDKVFFYNSYKNRNFGGIILIIILLFIAFLIILSRSYLPPYIPRDNTYKTGTFYSTIRIKDFNKRSKFNNFILKKLTSKFERLLRK